MSTVPSVEAEYDIIFAGGGAAACLTAGRLAAADPSLKILILESGPHTRDVQQHIQPGFYITHLHPSSTTVTFQVANPTDAVGGRSVIVPCGRCVGGGSSVNFMQYARAVASDYDDWETQHGNSGWGYKDLVPLLRKTETYQTEPSLPTHGYDGPLKVSAGGIYTNVGKEFMDYAPKYDKRGGITDDFNGEWQQNTEKLKRIMKWIDAETGKRSDVPHGFIYNQDHNNNLQVAAGCRVKRVIFEDDRAVGVEFLNDIRVYPNANQDIRVVRASRLVVVSAGAFGSPGILERSGIGAKDVLKRSGVEQKIDLPGVGATYHDHVFTIVPYLAHPDAETYDYLIRGEPDEYTKQITQWVKDKTGLMAANGIDAGIKLRPSAQELNNIGPDFEARWKKYYEGAPDKPVLCLMALSGYPGDQSNMAVRRYMSFGHYLTYPAATGHVHIKSNDVYEALDFDSGFLQDPADMALAKWGYKIAREYARRHPLYQGECVAYHPEFPAGSAAATKEMEGPVPIDAADIVYTPEDDLAIETYERKTVATTWHALGTCPMKPRDKGGVVDARLNVYGIKNLKVSAESSNLYIDSQNSIAPSNVGANTYSTALVIGEKAAVIIAEELGIKL